MSNIKFILFFLFISININSMEIKKRRISQDISAEIFKHSENSPFKKFKRDKPTRFQPTQETSKKSITIYKELDPYKTLLIAVRENNQTKVFELISQLVSLKRPFIKEGATAFKEAKKNNRYLYLLMIQHEYDCRMKLLETEDPYQESSE